MTHWLEIVRAHRVEHPIGFPAAAASWHDGAWGEILIGQELALLPDGWHALHAVPAGSGGADIDHLVIGPGGVFVINTKRHRGKSISVGTHVVWADGYPQNHYQRDLLARCDQVVEVLRRATGEVHRVYPLLVFVEARRLDQKGDQSVWSTTAQELVHLLVSRPPVLNDEQVARAVTAAAHPATWGASPRVLLEPDPTNAFLALSLQPAEAPASLTRASRPHGTGPTPPPPAPRRPAVRRTASGADRRRGSRKRTLRDRAIELFGTLIAIGIALAVLEAMLNGFAHQLMSK